MAFKITLRIHKLSLPGMVEGDHAYIRELPASITQDDENLSDVDKTCRMIVASLCDESGVLLMTGNDVKEPLTWPLNTFKAVVDAIVEFNGLGNELGN